VTWDQIIKIGSHPDADELAKRRYTPAMAEEWGQAASTAARPRKAR